MQQKCNQEMGAYFTTQTKIVSVRSQAANHICIAEKSDPPQALYEIAEAGCNSRTHQQLWFSSLSLFSFSSYLAWSFAKTALISRMAEH